MSSDNMNRILCYMHINLMTFTHVTITLFQNIQMTGPLSMDHANLINKQNANDG